MFIKFAKRFLEGRSTKMKIADIRLKILIVEIFAVPIVYYFCWQV